MGVIFKNLRKIKLHKNDVFGYLAYAIGEIILIIIGILIAVAINKNIADKNNSDIRCEYLKELSYTFEYDIKDVEENIKAIETWNPKLELLLSAIQNKKLIDLDSISDKINTVSQYIFFGQRSKSKIEELKYSKIDLIRNRNLKNMIVLYQDSDVMFLKNVEGKYNLVDEERRQYFSKNIIARDITKEKLENDRQFFSVVYQKYTMNEAIKNVYTNLLKKQYEIKKLIDLEVNEVCNEDTSLVKN
jgi:hypothetical protein